MKQEIKNAIIKRTMLGKEDHGIPTCYLHLDFGGSGQGFGGHDLRFKAYGIKYLTKILETVGVDTWEDLPGKHVKVDTSHTHINGIGHIIEDTWFYPEKDLGTAVKTEVK